MKKILMCLAIALPLVAFAAEEVVGYLGVSTRNLSDAMKIALDLEHGVLVEWVGEDSPAEAADIKVGDVILEIDGTHITNYSTLKDVIKDRPNKRVDVVLNRKDKKMTKKVMLGERDKRTLTFEMDIPDVKELREIWGRSRENLREQIEELKDDIEKLREELEEIRIKVK
jgi:C-terminal processing protease CtpA/Prc